MPRGESVTLDLDGGEVTISNPSKVYFEKAGITKLDLVNYYLAVADGAILGVRNRPMALKRFVDRCQREPFVFDFQLRFRDAQMGILERRCVAAIEPAQGRDPRVYPFRSRLFENSQQKPPAGHH